MLMKEYRICMPLTVEEVAVRGSVSMNPDEHLSPDITIDQGVEVVQNEPYDDPEHGSGQFTEKRIYLNNKLPSWARAVVPKIFYVTEKAWNYYPYTITGAAVERCSFLPKFSIHIESKYEDNKGSNDNIFSSEPKEEETEVCTVDIAYDEIPERHYKDSEDLRYFKSKKTNRGILQEGWIDSQEPIMCSYKLVTVKFEVWGLQTRVEQYVHKVIRDVLLLGHRQAFAWVDEWIACDFSTEMTMEEVREYERATQEATNLKIGSFPPAISISETPLPSVARSGPSSAPSTPSPQKPQRASQEEVCSGDPDPAGPGPQGFPLQAAKLFLLELQSAARMRAGLNAFDPWTSGGCLPSTSHNNPSASRSEGDFSLSW
ncbi:hypothetical protein F7725_003515 [Dissostichus mawsoni]|uniref:Cytoplasmic phosphatidylinositol transfer protein 1 n=1 Tax=Dissostichus mawsoni TaxID=36200 RepID=A0A7J5YD34_DISMA|nr:hypothetical protein F7725_003515 [Dissostichus mawsoni]